MTKLRGLGVAIDVVNQMLAWPKSGKNYIFPRLKVSLDPRHPDWSHRRTNNVSRMTRVIFLCWKMTVTTMCPCKQQSARLYLDIPPVGISPISPWIMRTTRVNMTVGRSQSVSQNFLLFPSFSLSLNVSTFWYKASKISDILSGDLFDMLLPLPMLFFNLFSLSKIIVCHHFNLTFVLNLSLTNV